MMRWELEGSVGEGREEWIAVDVLDWSWGLFTLSRTIAKGLIAWR